MERSGGIGASLAVALLLLPAVVPAAGAIHCRITGTRATDDGVEFVITCEGPHAPGPPADAPPQVVAPRPVAAREALPAVPVTLRLIPSGSGFSFPSGGLAEWNPTFRGEVPAPPLSVEVTLLRGELGVSRLVGFSVCAKAFEDGEDGHPHSRASQADGCDASRPAGRLAVPPDSRAPCPAGGARFAVCVRTGSDGSAFVEFIPALAGDAPIAGRTTIRAETLDPPALAAHLQVVTRVRGLVPLDLSRECRPDGALEFQRQRNHGCLFSTTATTAAAMRDIAAEFMRRQSLCLADPDGPACIVRDVVAGHARPRPIEVRLRVDRVRPVEITAASLPWGGLSDIHGDWAPPHLTHLDGRQVDVGWRTHFGVAEGWNTPLLRLFREVAQENCRFVRFPDGEGGDLARTARSASPHFHLEFRDACVPPPPPLARPTVRAPWIL